MDFFPDFDCQIKLSPETFYQNKPKTKKVPKINQKKSQINSAPYFMTGKFQSGAVTAPPGSAPSGCRAITNIIITITRTTISSSRVVQCNIVAETLAGSRNLFHAAWGKVSATPQRDAEYCGSPVVVLCACCGLV